MGKWSKEVRFVTILKISIANELEEDRIAISKACLRTSHKSRQKRLRGRPYARKQHGINDALPNRCRWHKLRTDASGFKPESSLV